MATGAGQINAATSPVMREWLYFVLFLDFESRHGRYLAFLLPINKQFHAASTHG